MNKLFKWSRGWWLEAQLAAPPVVQRTVMPRLHEAKEIARLMMRPHLTAYQWQGQSQGGSLVVSYAGLGHGTSFLKSFFFTEKPTEKVIGQLSTGSLNKQINSLNSDLVIVEASQHLTRRLPPRGAIALPFRLQQVVHIQPEWDDVWNSFHSSARKQDVRLVKKYGYEYELSQNHVDIDMFYHTMYVPTTLDRHGELASVDPLENLYRFFKHGFLMLIKRDGRPVSGSICSVHGRLVNLVTTGVVEANNQLMREGAVAAIYYFLLLWAHGAGYQAVNLGFCWPFLKDGIFQFKRKWGAMVVIPPREHKRIWIRIQRQTPAVTQFLKENPPVVISPDGALQGLVFIDDPLSATAQARVEWDKKYGTPGLASLLIRSIGELVGEVEKDNHRERH